MGACSWTDYDPQRSLLVSSTPQPAWRSSFPFSWRLDERKPVVFPFSVQLATRRTEPFGIYYAQAAIECQFVFRRRARSIRVFVPSGCFAQDSYRRGPDFFRLPSCLRIFAPD